MSSGITFRLSAVLAVFAIMASGLTGYYAYDDGRRLLLAHSEKNLQSEVQIIGQNLLLTMNATARNARFLASRANMADGSFGTPHTNNVLQAARSLMQVHPEYLHISLIDARSGWRETVRIVREGTNIRQIINPKDSLEAYLKPVLRLTPGQVYMSEAFAEEVKGEDERQISFLSASPIARENGMNSNILVAIRVEFASFAQNIIGASLLPAIQFCISDSMGNQLYVSQSNDDKIDWKGKTLDAIFPAASAMFEGDTLYHNDILSSDGHADGRLTVFKRVQPMDFSNGRYFILTVSRPIILISQEIQMLWENMWRIVFSFSFIAIFLAWMVSQAITRPLATILTSVQRFATGEKSDDILQPIKERQDEIGLLADGVEKMHAQIRAQLLELEGNHQAMQHMAHHDALTGLANRLTFFRLTENAIAQARRHDYKFAVLFIDLDHFKEVNDKYGHNVGDQLLLAVASRLKEGVRESDVVARLAGDEFVVMLNPVHNGVEAELVAKKLLQRLNSPLVIQENEKEIDLAIWASIGISMYPDHGATSQELIEAADEAMYSSKGSGRNNCTLAKPGLAGLADSNL